MFKPNKNHRNLAIVALTLCLCSLANADATEATKPQVPAWSGIQYGVCQTWALSAVTILVDAREHHRTPKETIAKLYDEPHPYLVKLVELGQSAGKTKSRNELERLSEFLIGYCYANPPVIKPQV